ncbi:MAG: TraR/DksA C4-type zinc finger protein [Nitrospinota bacterium]|jgi:DnaK suppressor protein|nr:TraR/DksA C4-type zinc finger protein [Nitrospinota bacterium]MDP7580512.1 TraR/DksA C4-type zinc finger protein [Nitrospinota bacterium]HJN01898.1 TraR/DksA C4-type zinc finger protein [Nitrospinota bacterium]|tara:strand:+ start:496 stop:1101 length:606 start_codon:yes stop_codon:yes gene_type:complete
MAKKKAAKKKVFKRELVKAKVKKKKKKSAKIKKKAKKKVKKKVLKRKVKIRTIKKKGVRKKTAKKKPQKKLKTTKKVRIEEIKEIEHLLLNQRAELLRLISRSSAWEKDISKLERGDLQDMAATSLEREMTFAMGSREREEFRMINSALKKITLKTYGICEGCGENINIKRIKILPFAQYCMECKSSMEQEMLLDNEDIFK